MKLNAVDKVNHIHPSAFKEKYYNPMKPVVIKDLAKEWPAYTTWNWDLFQ